MGGQFLTGALPLASATGFDGNFMSSLPNFPGRSIGILVSFFRSFAGGAGSQCQQGKENRSY